jgi:hypothetical protein
MMHVFRALLVVVAISALSILAPVTAQPPKSQRFYTPILGSGLSGKEFKTEFVPDGGRLVSIQANVGKWRAWSDLVQGAKFVYEDDKGTKHEVQIGPCGGQWEKATDVPKGVRLVGISGSYGLVMDGLRFHFSDGSKSPLYGGKGGDFEFQVSVKEHDRGPGIKGGRYHKTVRGIWGRASEDSFVGIGLICEDMPFEK